MRVKTTPNVELKHLNWGKSSVKFQDNSPGICRVYAWEKFCSKSDWLDRKWRRDSNTWPSRSLTATTTTTWRSTTCWINSFSFSLRHLPSIKWWFCHRRSDVFMTNKAIIEILLQRQCCFNLYADNSSQSRSLRVLLLELN